MKGAIALLLVVCFSGCAQDPSGSNTAADPGTGKAGGSEHRAGGSATLACPEDPSRPRACPTKSALLDCGEVAYLNGYLFMGQDHALVTLADGAGTALHQARVGFNQYWTGTNASSDPHRDGGPPSHDKKFPFKGTPGTWRFAVEDHTPQGYGYNYRMTFSCDAT